MAIQSRYFFPALALQLLLGLLVTVGLIRLGFWKTAVLEIVKVASVLRLTSQWRRESLNSPAAALLLVSAFSDAVLISYDVQRGGH